MTAAARAAYIHAYMHTCTHAHIHACTRTHAYTRIHAYRCTHRHTYVHGYLGIPTLQDRYRCRYRCSSARAVTRGRKVTREGNGRRSRAVGTRGPARREQQDEQPPPPTLHFTYRLMPEL